MLVTMDKVESGIARYLDSEVMPKLPSSGWQRMAVGTALSLAVKKYGTAASGLVGNPWLEGLGIMNKAGEVDVDLLGDAIKENIPSDGMRVNLPVLGGMTFYRADMDKLRDYIVR